jgi:hypothetical protein
MRSPLEHQRRLIGDSPRPKELLLAATNDELVRLAQARHSLLRHMTMRNSYQAFLHTKIAALNASPFQAFPQTQPQVHAPVMYRPTEDGSSLVSEISKMGSTMEALEALGRCPRQSTDPYIDVSSVGDQSPSDVQASKRTRGGVIEPFPVRKA